MTRVPRKQTKEIKSEEAVHNESLVKPHKKPIIPTASVDTGFSTESAYEKYDEFMAQEKAQEQALINPEAELEKPAAVQPEPAIQASEAQPAVIEVVEEVQQKSEPAKKEEYITKDKSEIKIEKTVPLAALHEAREKEKHERQRRIELENRLTELEAQKNLSGSEQFDSTDYQYASKSELKTIQQEIESIKREKQAQELERQLTHVDEILTKEGMSGFRDFGRILVSQRLNEMYAEDPVYAIAHDNPEGWAKIYREDIFPKLKQELIQQDIQTVMQKKEELKKNAGMVAQPGIKDVKDVKPTAQSEVPKTREELNAEYVRQLRANSL